MSLLKELFQIIEKDTSFSASYANDVDIKKLRRRRGKKEIETFLVKESLTFTATGEYHKESHEIWIKVMSNHPHDDYYDDYQGINVIINKSNGEIVDYGYAKNDAKAHEELKNYKNKISDVAKDFARTNNLL